MIGALALLFAAQSADLAPPPVRAQPRTPLAAYIGADDYPASAQARHEEGSVAFQLVVGADGRVADCAILASSGSSALANATCRIMRSRARFTAARDERGHAVADSGLAIVHWSLAGGAASVQPYLPAATGVAPLPSAGLVAVPVIEPPRARANLASYVSDDDYPASALKRGEQGRVAFSLAIGADGRVADCRITRSSGSSALDNATCRIMRSRARFTPARNALGHPAPGTHDGELRWLNSSPRPAPAAQ
jgi:TonB family protein